MDSSWYGLREVWTLERYGLLDIMLLWTLGIYGLRGGMNSGDVWILVSYGLWGGKDSAEVWTPRRYRLRCGMDSGDVLWTPGWYGLREVSNII